MKKILVLMLIAAMLIGVLAGCAATEEPVQPVEPAPPVENPVEEPAEVEEKTLVIGLSTDVTTWNPYARNQITANAVQKHVFEALILVGDDMSHVPGLAVSWEANEDSTVWTIKLREGVTFHNGAKFVADDVVFSFDRVLETAIGWVDSMATIGSYRAIDDTTVEITCSTPDALLPATLRNLVIISKETHEGKGLENLEVEVVGTGKYELVEYLRDDKVVLKRNENYWGDKPEIQNVVFRTIPNEGTRTASLISEEIDFSEIINVRDAQMMENLKNIKVVSAPSISANMFVMVQVDGDPSPNSDYPLLSPDGSNPLNNRDVREAIVRAIDVNELIEVVMSGYATPTNSVVPEGFNGYNPNLTKYDFNPEKAMELLDNAGYPMQTSGELEGYRFAITLDHQERNATMSTAIAGYLGRVGIKCYPNTLANAIVWDHVRMYDSYKCHFLVTSWSNPAGESAMIAKDTVYSAPFDKAKKDGFGGVNRGYYVNEEVDVLIEQALATADYDARDEIMQQVWKIVNEDVAHFSLFRNDNIYGVGNDFEYTPRTDGYIYAWDFN